MMHILNPLNFFARAFYCHLIKGTLESLNKVHLLMLARELMNK